MIARERLLSSGATGLDEILQGGFKRGQLYAVAGPLGSGKTTLGLQFLRAGADAGERSLYIGFAETAEDLRRVAYSHGWSLSGVALHCMAVESEVERGDYTLFPASAVELHGLLRDMLDVIGAEAPDRLVIDPISVLRWYADDRYQYRRLVEGFARMLSVRGVTTLFLEEMEEEREQWITADGLLALRAERSGSGSGRRELEVVKLRAVPVASGAHEYRIARGGIEVHPRPDTAPAAAGPAAFERTDAVAR